MRSLNKYTLNVRRETFLRGIRTHQREIFKAEKRTRLLEHCLQTDHIWQFRMALFTLDLRFEQHRVIAFLEFLREHASQQAFCQQIAESVVLEQLIQLIAASLMKDKQLQVAWLVEQLFELLYHLLAQHSPFLGVIQRHFGHLVYFLYRYPCHTNNLDKLSRFLTCISDPLSSQTWREHYQHRRLMGEQQVIGQLLAIYICKEGYVVNKGGQLNEIPKRSHKWFKNAIKCLEVVYGLIQIQLDRTAIWEADIVNNSLCEGLNVFLNEKQFFIEYYDSDSTDSDSMSEVGLESCRRPTMEREETNLYFISVILDILLVREKVLQSREASILQGILSILLKQLNRHNIINMTVIKVIKILYEQMILQEEELRTLADNFEPLRFLIENIIQSDIC